MADYDNTNRGAVFPPREGTSMILNGRIDVNGDNRYVALVKTQTKGGKPIIEVYEKVGALFANEKKESEGSPHYTGGYENNGIKRRLAAWRRTSKDGGAPYMSLSLNEMTQNANHVNHVEQDEIPF